MSDFVHVNYFPSEPTGAGRPTTTTEGDAYYRLSARECRTPDDGSKAAAVSAAARQLADLGCKASALRYRRLHIVQGGSFSSSPISHLAAKNNVRITISIV